VRSNKLTYRKEIVKAMQYLAGMSNALFLGQSICFPGHAMFSTLEDANVPMDKRLELPVFEDTQMGISIGLALGGFLPISIYPRMDFLIIAMNQLVNHLDRMEEMSHRRFQPKVIIRTMVGSKKPLDAGPQHTNDYTEALDSMLTTVSVIKLTTAENILPVYREAARSTRSSIIVEMADLY